LSLIAAILKDEALLADAEQYRSDNNHFHLWWLGQSGYLLQWKGKKILIDPYLSDSLTRKYANTNKPHVRMSERVIDPKLFKDIFIVTSSHNHTDHLDGDTLMPLIKNNPHIHFIIPEANRAFVADRVQCDKNFPIGLNDGDMHVIGDFSFYGILAKHNEIERDDKGNSKYMGYLIQFGHWSVYHSGDTLWVDDIVDTLKPFNVDVALLPINGNEPSRGVAGNLDVKEAALLGKSVGAKTVIPCHYNMFEFNTANPDDFAIEAEKIDQPFSILQQGERWDSNSL